MILAAFWLGENCCNISAQKIMKEIFLLLSFVELEVRALHYANELLVRVKVSSQKLLQTLQTSRNNKKLSKTCFGYA